MTVRNLFSIVSHTQLVHLWSLFSEKEISPGLHLGCSLVQENGGPNISTTNSSLRNALGLRARDGDGRLRIRRCGEAAASVHMEHSV